MVNIKQTNRFRTNEYALRSILQNLIHNAILYRKKNVKSAVHVSIYESGSNIIIEIKDNGIGIPEKIQERVFEMFFRGSSETEGSGLGLYLVKNAVDRLKGTIKMKSVYGEGTEFEITLPVTSA